MSIASIEAKITKQIAYLNGAGVTTPSVYQDCLDLLDVVKVARETYRRLPDMEELDDLEAALIKLAAKP
jgi:hypothetical protein